MMLAIGDHFVTLAPMARLEKCGTRPVLRRLQWKPGAEMETEDQRAKPA
jgi:hypothetical protein